MKFKIHRLEPEDFGNGPRVTLEMSGKLNRDALRELIAGFHDDADFLVIRRLEKVGAAGSDERAAEELRRQIAKLNRLMRAAARRGIVIDLGQSVALTLPDEHKVPELCIKLKREL